MLPRTNLKPKPCSKNLWLLTILVLQNSLTALVGRFTRKAAPEDLYNISHLVLVGEVGKLLISLPLEAWTERNLSSFRTHLWMSPRETLKMAIPALLYWGSNTLQFVALSKLTVPIFQVAYQGKLVITALVSVCALGRSYDARQWCCLVVISLSLAFIVSEDSIRNGGSDDSATELTAQNGDISPDICSNLSLGLCAIAIACLLSAFAGVYFEYVVKTESIGFKTPSLWMRNIQLAFFSIIIALVHLKLSEESESRKKPYFYGFTFSTWCQVALFAGGGLLVAAVIKHADNVVKGLATGVSVLVSTAGSMMLYKTSFTPIFSICAATTVASVLLFSSKSNSWSQNKLPLTTGLVLSFVLINLITPIRNLRLQDYKTTNELTKFFPTNWNSTTTALDEFRSLQNKVTERHIQEAMHILYDLRTAIGNRPAKYLEIGSYTGTTAALMLRHPMPTFTTLVDPCVLDPVHFEGSLSQEETIRKNLKSLLGGNMCSGDFRPWDLRVGYSPEALPNRETFDIIHIDGNHTVQEVWSDYHETIELLRPGGFMVFHGYLSSPEVKLAVDAIARSTMVIKVGTPANIHGIDLDTDQSFINEYIFQQKGNFKYLPQLPLAVANSQPILGIAVACYRRPNEMTARSLEQLWKMLLSQSYRKWILYLTGDFYDNETEWESLSFFNHVQARLYNLPEPGERGKMEGHDLWLHGGIAAMNNAINRLVADGIEWAVRIDDDDIWDSDHLENVLAGIGTGATFVMSECQYCNSWLPTTPDLTNISHIVFPGPCQIIHSSVAFNAVKLTSRYRISPKIPGDADLWSRIIYDDYFYPAFVPIKSCHHLQEGGSKAVEIIQRGFELINSDPPPGWYKNASRYTSLVSETFPSNLSNDCVYIIGAEMAPPDDYPHRFVKLSSDMIPYHIRAVEAFVGLPVWRKQ